MKGILEKHCELRTSDFDCNRKILPSAVLDIFQEAAGIHGELLGVGFEDMLKRELFWVLTKVRFEILEDVKMHQQIKIKTWPLPPQKICYRREYIIFGEEGRELIRGSSEWVAVHSLRRKIMPAVQLYDLTEGEFCNKQAIEGKFKKIKSFESEDKGFEILPCYCDIDLNGHVNNTKYADFVFNAISPEKSDIKSFGIDYHKEVLRGNKLNIHTKNEGNTTLALGNNADGDIMFSCFAEWK